MSVIAKAQTMLSGVRGFLREVRAELGKVAWPTRRQLWNSTRVVLVSTALLAIYIWLCDSMASQVIRLIAR